jgi:ABC-type taurine transport system ATPase subunit
MNIPVVDFLKGFWYAGRTNDTEGFGTVRLPNDEQASLMTDHVPAQLQFEKLTYNLSNHTILENVMGSVKSGQVMAIMGPSGAGKSTLLDILARKQKKGAVDGRVLINGREVDDAIFKKVMGFVDQEDTLMPTLTVYETVLYSALLRLPRDMSYEAKKFRTLETMHELGILGIKDSRIGESGGLLVHPNNGPLLTNQRQAIYLRW